MTGSMSLHTLASGKTQSVSLNQSLTVRPLDYCEHFSKARRALITSCAPTRVRMLNLLPFHLHRDSTRFTSTSVVHCSVRHPVKSIRPQ